MFRELAEHFHIGFVRTVNVFCTTTLNPSFDGNRQTLTAHVSLQWLFRRTYQHFKISHWAWPKLRGISFSCIFLKHEVCHFHKFHTSRVLLKDTCVLMEDTCVLMEDVCVLMENTCVLMEDTCVLMEDMCVCVNGGYMCVNGRYMCVIGGYLCVNGGHTCVNLGYMCCEI